MAAKKPKIKVISLGKKGTMKLREGTFTAQAKARGLTPAQFQKKVLAAPKGKFAAITKKRAVARKVLVGFKKPGRKK